MGWGPEGDRGRWSCMEPTPTNTPELGKAAGSLSFAQGRRSLPPFGTGRKHGSVESIHNHLGDTWHGKNGWHYITLYVLPRGGELEAPCGF